jgi:hypothetical protein
MGCRRSLFSLRLLLDVEVSFVSDASSTLSRGCVASQVERGPGSRHDLLDGTPSRENRRKYKEKENGFFPTTLVGRETE